MEMSWSEKPFFGELLQQFRKRKRLNQTQLAELIGVSRETVSLWERGYYKPETDTILYELCKVRVLGLTEQEQQQLFEAYTVTALASSFHNPPLERNPYFTGRSPQLTDLHTLLMAGKQVALTQAISGLGGIGKTQLALEYAYRYQKSYHDIFWIVADTYELLMASYIRLAALLLLPEHYEPDQSKVKAAVHRWLSKHTGWLLILDNVEDLSLVHQFVPVHRQGVVLLTTQRQVTEPIAQSIEVEMMPEEEGALFLLRRAGYLELGSLLNDDSCKLDKNTIATAKDIARELGGLPLALDQAGAFILETGCSLIKYLDLYTQQRYALLQKRGSVCTDHPESVTTTFSLAFERLVLKNAAASELLRFFAFLAPDSIPEEIVRQGASFGTSLLQSLRDELAFNEAIKALLGLSLVYRNRVRETFSVHRLVQVVLKETMDEVEQRWWAERAIRAINRVFPDVQETEEWPECQQYLPHAQSSRKLIHEWSFEFEEAAQLLHRVGNYLRERSRDPHAEELYTRAEVIYEELSESRDFEIEKTYIIHDRGRLYSYLEKYGEAKRDYGRALRILKQRLKATHARVAQIYDDPFLLERVEQEQRVTEARIAQIYNDLGLVYLEQCEPHKGQRYLEKALAKGVLSEFHKATATGNLARCFVDQGAYKQAEEKYNELKEMIEELPLRHQAWLFSNMATFYFERSDRRDYEKAESYCQKSLKSLNDLLGEEGAEKYPNAAFPYTRLGEVYEAQGKNKEAERSFQHALTIRKSTLGSKHRLTGNSYHRLAKFYRKWGEEDRSKWTQAKEHYKWACKTYKHVLGSGHNSTVQVCREYLELCEMMEKGEEAEIN